MQFLGINLALHILPHIPAFQYSSRKSHDNQPVPNFILIEKRLSNAGLLIYNEVTCNSDNIIQLYEDLFLAAGSVRNQITNCIYEAPIFIQRSLSKQGLKVLEDRSVTKILVLPRETTIAVNRNNLFTGSSLIQKIIIDKLKRDSYQKSYSDESSKKSSMTMFEHIKCENRTCSTKRIDQQHRINDDSRHPQTTANIHRFLLATSNK